MKVFVLLCFVGAAFAVREPEVYSCTDPPETGPCRAYVPSYYYDPETDTCKKFIYGGCQGNGNRYSTEGACLVNCKGNRHVKLAVPSDVCFLDKKPGMCLAYMPRYYYNRETGQCEKFIYGGCQGNGNNFYTLEECQATCVSDPQAAALDRPDCDKGPEPGNCMAYIPRFYYDQEAGMCKKFIYGGCGGNRNNFKTEEECYNKCGALQSTSTCDQPKEVGLCKAAFPRYYYNKETGRCEFFIYGGCGGNDNNFNNKEDCEAVCAPRAHRAPEHCHLKPETGLCRGYFPRYYYNVDTGKCEDFVYGGCGGNKNNFETEEECMESCSA